MFDAKHPPAVAFIRSLGLAGVPVTVFANSRMDVGRYSRYVAEVREAPSPEDTDEFVTWLTAQIRDGAIDLVAPTSDAVVFAIAEAADRLADGAVSWAPAPAAVRACLFKLEFSRAMAHAGLPAPATCCPRDLDEAKAVARSMGYPVLLKARSHVGMPEYRGMLISNETELAGEFERNRDRDLPTSARAHDPLLSVPLLQQFMPVEQFEVVSLSGCLGRDGALLSLGLSRKLDQWPPHVGIGTLFEAIPADGLPYVERAVQAIRDVIGFGLFELEVLVDNATGQAWPIDLNARGYGQISLEIARGNDLPLLWYRAVTGLDVASTNRSVDAKTRYWRQGVPYYAGQLVRLVGEPGRIARVRRILRRHRYPSVGAVMAWNDLAPVIAFVLTGFRHPGGLIKPFFRHTSNDRVL